MQKFVKKRATPRLVRSSIPFDWDKGFDIEEKIGLLPRLNQGPSSSCGGQAGAYFDTVQRRLAGSQEQCSAKSIYAPIAYPTGGTTSIALETQLGANGSNLESEVPSYQGGNPPSELFMTDMSWQNSILKSSAYFRAGYLPQAVKIRAEEMACAIRDYGGIIVHIVGQNNGSWLSAYPIAPNNRKDNWHHFMYGKGAKMINGKKYIAFMQSWGTDIGDNGVQYISEDYINSGYLAEAFTFIKGTTNPKTSNVIWAAVLKWFSDNIFKK